MVNWESCTELQLRARWPLHVDLLVGIHPAGNLLPGIRLGMLLQDMHGSISLFRTRFERHISHRV